VPESPFSLQKWNYTYDLKEIKRSEEGVRKKRERRREKGERGEEVFSYQSDNGTLSGVSFA
jgi:hypothetical protein